MNENASPTFQLSDFDFGVATLIALATKAQIQVDTYSSRPAWNPSRRPSQAVMVAERDTLVTAVVMVGGGKREGTGAMRSLVDESVRRIAAAPMTDSGFAEMAERALPLIDRLRRFRETGEMV